MPDDTRVDNPKMSQHVCDPMHVAEATVMRAHGFSPPKPGSTEAIRVAVVFNPIEMARTRIPDEYCQECGVLLSS